MAEPTPAASDPILPGHDDTDDLIVPGENDLTPYVISLTLSASLSGLLFGYDTGVISGTLVAIRSDLGHALSISEKSAITAATTLGALVGALCAPVADRGRKKALAIANVLFIAGALMQAVAGTVGLMVAGRVVVGLGVGLASATAPLYIGELAPRALRGRLVTVNVLTCTGGQVVAYGIGALLQNHQGGWRWMVGLGAVPAIVQILWLRFLPESPRILLQHNDLTQATSILRQIYPRASPDQVSRKTALLASSLRATSQGSLSLSERLGALLQGPNLRPLIIGMSLQGLQQLCGFNTLMYFSATIFDALGMSNGTATGLLIAAVNFIFTVVSLKIVDPLGRRRTMLLTLPIMTLFLLLVAYNFKFLRLNDPQASDRTHTWFVIVSMLGFVAAYATGLGNIPWQQSELFSDVQIRALGSSICTMTNWTANLLVSSTFLPILDRFGGTVTFTISAAVCALGWLILHRIYPETSGLSLEEVGKLFEKDWGVQRSLAERRAREVV